MPTNKKRKPADPDALKTIKETLLEKEIEEAVELLRSVGYCVPDDPGFTYSMQDIAKRWNVDYQTVRALIQSGKLQAFKTSGEKGSYRVRADVLFEYETRPSVTPYKPKHGAAFGVKR